MELAKLAEVVRNYKNKFDIRWPEEKYKWQNIKQFQDNWDIDAENFVEMLEKAIPATNLLVSRNFFPRGMIIAFANNDPEKVRSMFRNLYNEQLDLKERITDFIKKSEEIRVKYGADEWGNHYQTENVVSIYLWLKFPDKYYIYKPMTYKNFIEVVGYQPDKKFETIKPIECFNFYNEVKDLVKTDKELVEKLLSSLTPDCYNDTSLNTLVNDIAFYLYQEKHIIQKSKEFFVEALNNAQLSFSEKNRFYNVKIANKDYKFLVRSYNGNVNNIAKSQMPELREDIYVAIIWCNNNTPESIYLIPSTEWDNKGSDIFVERNYEGLQSNPEWGINLTKNKKSELEPFEFAKVIYALNKQAGNITDDEKRYWVIAAGENACEWETFKEESIIAIGYNDFQLGDLTQYDSKQAIIDKLKTINEEFASKKNDIHALWQFANEMKPDDIVYVKTTRTEIIARGIVTSDYYFDESKESYNNIRKVKWTNIGVWQSPYRQPIKTLTDITTFKEDVKKMEEIIFGTTDEQTQLNKYTKEDYLKQVYQSDEDYETLKSLLINKKNIILQGCPGVGKSFSARKLAYTIMGEIDDTRIKYIQFHQNYSYEDFIMGYKPNDDGFKLETGVFYEFCKKAENDPQKRPYFFIIDEINRGNLSKVFGELLLAIENEYRGKPITLAYDRTTFTVPKNLYIIGMMNTADRSLAMIDYALRRRFSFFPMNPAFGSDGFIKYQESLHNEKFNKLIETIKKLNIAISNDESLGEGFCIGHSYFCNKNADECSDSWLKEVVNYDILPTLQEYWFDDKDSYETWGKELSGVVDDNR